MRKEVHFLSTNRMDLEAALGSVSEEKRMLERELLALRGQLRGTVKLGTTMAGVLPPLPVGTLGQGMMHHNHST